MPVNYMELMSLTDAEFVDLLTESKDNLPILKSLRNEFSTCNDKKALFRFTNDFVSLKICEFMNDNELDVKAQIEFSIIFLFIERCQFSGSVSAQSRRISRIFEVALEMDQDRRRFAIEVLTNVCSQIRNIFYFVENLKTFYDSLNSDLDFYQKYDYLKRILFRVRPVDETAIGSFLDLSLSYCQEIIDRQIELSENIKEYIHLGILMIGQILRFSQPKITRDVFKRMEKVLASLFMSNLPMNDDKLSILSLIKFQLCQLNVESDWVLKNPLIKQVLLDSDRILPRISKSLRDNMKNYIMEPTYELRELLSLCLMNWNKRDNKHSVSRLIRTNDSTIKSCISTELMIIQKRNSHQPLSEQLWNQLERCDEFDSLCRQDEDEYKKYLVNFKNIDDEDLVYLYQK